MSAFRILLLGCSLFGLCKHSCLFCPKPEVQCVYLKYMLIVICSQTQTLLYLSLLSCSVFFLCTLITYSTPFPHPQRLESQHTVRPGPGLVHSGLHGFLRNVS